MKNNTIFSLQGQTTMSLFEEVQFKESSQSLLNVLKLQDSIKGKRYYGEGPDEIFRCDSPKNAPIKWMRPVFTEFMIRDYENRNQTADGNCKWSKNGNRISKWCENESGNLVEVLEKNDVKNFFQFFQKPEWELRTFNGIGPWRIGIIRSVKLSLADINEVDSIKQKLSSFIPNGEATPKTKKKDGLSH